MKSFKFDTEGVPPPFAIMLLVVVIVTIVAGVFVWILPMIYSSTTDSRYRSVLACFERMDESIENVIQADVGSAERTSLVIPEGTVTIYDDEERWVISYNLEGSSTDVIFYKFWGRYFYVHRESGGTDSLLAHIYWLELPDKPVAHVMVDPVTGCVAAPRSLDGTVKIVISDVSDATNPIDIAVAWSFSLDSITYSLKGPLGTYIIREVNCALGTNYPTGYSIINSPRIDIGSDQRTLTLYMVRFTPRGPSGISEGSYRVDLTLLERETELVTYAHNVRLEIFSSYNTSWYTELTPKTYNLDMTTYTGFIYKDGRLFYQAPDHSNPDNNNIINLKLVYCNVGIKFGGGR